jgi:hypothetical protein
LTAELQNLHSWVRIPPAPPDFYLWNESGRRFFPCTPRVPCISSAMSGSRLHALVKSASSCSCRERTQGHCTTTLSSVSYFLPFLLPDSQDRFSTLRILHFGASCLVLIEEQRRISVDRASPPVAMLQAFVFPTAPRVQSSRTYPRGLHSKPPVWSARQCRLRGHSSSLTSRWD